MSWEPVRSQRVTTVIRITKINGIPTVTGIVFQENQEKGQLHLLTKGFIVHTEFQGEAD